MECDWEVEIGGDAPIIDAAWDGFVDLRREPMRVEELVEVAGFAALAKVLLDLNAPKSPVWTSKCDVFPELAGGDFDAMEMDADPAIASFAAGCYIDLIPDSPPHSDVDQIVESYCKAWCSRAGVVALRGCRIDFVVRRAITESQNEVTESPSRKLALGITAYVTACGATTVETKAMLGFALTALARVISPDSTLQ